MRPGAQGRGLVLNTNHDVGCLDNGGSGLANLQPKLLNSGVGNRGRNNQTGGDLNLHDAVGSAFGNLNNGASELVTGRKLFMLGSFQSKRISSTCYMS